MICALLNSGGGVILFDCVEDAFNILIKGDKMTEIDKERYEQQVKENIKCFYPALEIERSIVFNFVPVIENPYTNHSTKLSYYKGEDAFSKGNDQYV